jgi:hypothetical protein
MSLIDKDLNKNSLNSMRFSQIDKIISSKSDSHKSYNENIFRFDDMDKIKVKRNLNKSSSNFYNSDEGKTILQKYYTN